MYSRSTSGRNGYRGTVPPPHYGGTSIHRERADEKTVPARERYIGTKTRIHPSAPPADEAVPERLSGRRPIGPDIGMSIFGNAFPDNDDGGKEETPLTECGECKDTPEPPEGHPHPHGGKKPFSPGERPDDILLAALIALLFGNRCDDELLLILVLLYIMGM